MFLCKLRYNLGGNRAKSRTPHQVPSGLDYYVEQTYISPTILARVPYPPNMHTPFFG